MSGTFGCVVRNVFSSGFAQAGNNRPVYQLILCCILLVFCSNSVNAASKHALVIGNSQYSVSPLGNPANDATDIVSTLRDLDFRVYRNMALLDLDLKAFEIAVRNFADSLPSEPIALFFYAGHGISDTQDNYLLPIDSNVVSQFDLRTRAVSVKNITDTLYYHNRKGANIVLLDACRNNPLGTDYRELPSAQ